MTQSNIRGRVASLGTQSTNDVKKGVFFVVEGKSFVQPLHKRGLMDETEATKRVYVGKIVLGKYPCLFS